MARMTPSIDTARPDTGLTTADTASEIRLVLGLASAGSLGLPLWELPSPRWHVALSGAAAAGACAAPPLLEEAPPCPVRPSRAARRAARSAAASSGAGCNSEASTAGPMPRAAFQRPKTAAMPAAPRAHTTSSHASSTTALHAPSTTTSRGKLPTRCKFASPPRQSTSSAPASQLLTRMPIQSTDSQSPCSVPACTVNSSSLKSLETNTTINGSPTLRNVA
mmetsp:Transcript_73931/g.238983  ORF Transcript_73931/g.238983 Transcript_73931/m.238983 type:complete len:221 (+) Transcript_73931:319-981(+)